MRSQFTHHDGVRLHYLDSGGESVENDRRAPIVFVPGMTCLAYDYEAVLPEFGRRTVVVEVRGHGRSDAPVDGYDLETLSGDVGAVVDAVTDGPVHIVTFSRGTSAAVLWTLGNAARVRSLSIGDYVPEEKLVPDDAVRWLLDGKWRGTPVRDRLDEKAALLTFQAAQERSFWEPLTELNIPLLAVRSPESRVIVPDEVWDRYARLFPSAQLVEFADSPHDIFRPDRARYPRLVAEHVDRADGR
ncbi:alpha/beta fold hydrolase [Mycolicibacterium confluentis]|uniref:3-oxoadipate enol-lactonase n=1 Tax=Mycolicibacterium confluentis TaxID=28047 RepID=A0A7I7XTK6_9MYCO|nr:alpha/beta fold hydrolase [Mycolicibacterium confluentis]MCV7322112.1 alpha/beta fold hydrolase [Mycolicibacterium confluentis]ORV27780.1 alpha/beta hydrolase [Mycolicibacterium confluentis]BBZ32596.1 3-oxoadipate enol-lactonase [Mycolicibacterium confluentis]